MALNIHALTFGQLSMDASGLVLFRNPGTKVTIPFVGYLITGGEEPVLVDTGSRASIDWAAFGMDYQSGPEMTVTAQLARFGLRPSDVRHVLHTHAHLDHSGQDDLFPMSTTVGITRAEMEFAASGIMGPGMYTAADTKHLIDRLHTPGAMRLFDVDGTFEEEVIPGVAVRLSGGHTPGSLSVLVETDDGLANIAGDIAYHIGDQLIEPILDLQAHEPTISGNRAMRSVEEKRAIKKALSDSRFLIVGHDAPALIERGKVIARHTEAFEPNTKGLVSAADYVPIGEKLAAA